MLKFAVLVAVAAAETNSSALLLDKNVCAYDRIRVNWTLATPPRDPHLALYETTPVIGNEGAAAAREDTDQITAAAARRRGPAAGAPRLVRRRRRRAAADGDALEC